MMKYIRIVLAFIVLAVVLTAISAVAAQNTVASSRVGGDTLTFDINDLYPTECGGLTLTNIVTGAGTITGTAANDLILGSAGDDTINGGAGTDCIIAGSGNDTIDGGGAETDVCLWAETISNCNP